MINKINITKPILPYEKITPKSININQFIKLGIYGVVYCFIAVIIFLCSASIIYFLHNPQSDNSNVIYYFFAAVAILANLSFSWSRSLPAGEPVVKKVIETGEISFLAAMIFLFASLFKYAFLHVSEIEELLSFNFDHTIKLIFLNIVSTLYVISYIIAIILVIYACIKITRIVMNRNFAQLEEIKSGKPLL